MNLDTRVQIRLYQLLYYHRERRRQAKFYNYLPTIYELPDKIETSKTI